MSKNIGYSFWSWPRLLLCTILGAIAGLVGSLPIILISTGFQDRPAFWVWPALTGIVALMLFFGGVGAQHNQ